MQFSLKQIKALSTWARSEKEPIIYNCFKSYCNYVMQKVQKIIFHFMYKF